MIEATTGGVAAENRFATDNVRRTATIERLAWPAYCVVIAVWAIGYITWPFSSDQGVLSWVGRVIAEGGFPYRDAWEIRGPVPFFAYAAIARVFGAAQWPLRVLDLAIVGAGVWCVSRVAAMYGGRLAARSAIVLYTLWYASFGHHDTAQSDGWNAAMMAGVTLAMLARNGSPRARDAVIAGVLLGLSILSKPTYAAFLLLPTIVGVTQVRRRGVPWLLGFWGAGALGLLVSAGPVLLWLYRGGAMDAFIDIHLRWLLTRYTDIESSWLNRVQAVGVFLTADMLATALAPAILGVAAVWRRDRAHAALLLAWVGGTLLTVMAQGNFYPYHWHPVLPAVATLAGIGIAVVVEQARLPNEWRRIAGFAIGGAAFVAAALRPLVHVYRLALLAVGITSRERFDAVEFGPYGRTGAFTQLSAYFQSHTKPDDRVLIWGSVPGVYYTAERRAPTRFGYTAPLVNPQDDAFRRRFRSEFIDGVTATAPVYIATLAPAVCEKAHNAEQRRLIGRTEERMRCIEELPELERLIAEWYAPDTTIGPILIYRRRESPPGAGTSLVVPPTTPAGR